MGKETRSEMSAIQDDLFPDPPRIDRLAVTKFSLKDGSVIGQLEALTNVPDVAMLTKEAWIEAVAGWLIELTAGSKFSSAISAIHHVDALRAAERIEREEAEAQQSSRRR